LSERSPRRTIDTITAPELARLYDELDAVRLYADVQDREFRARVESLEVALRMAIELAEEGWSYAGGYFSEKYDIATEVKKLKRVLEEGR
jgi:hypothetical protein